MEINTFTCFAHNGGVGNNLNDPTHLPHLESLFFKYYVVQVVNSQRGHHAAIILLHGRSGGNRQGPGSRTRKLAENGEMCEIRQITYKL